MIGEPDAGNPHVRFDEGVQETCDTRGAPAPYSTRVPRDLFLSLPSTRFVRAAHFQIPHFRRRHVSAFHFCMSLFR